jgi:hypothetical protein
VVQLEDFREWIMQGILYNFKAFTGTDYGHMILFLVCMCICIFLSKKKECYKFISVIFGISLLVLFNPLFYNLIGERFLSGVYWRLFWILPMGLVVAAVFTELTGLVKISIFKYLLAAALMLLAAVSGKLVLSRDNYSFPENPYQISSAVAAVCDTILEDSDARQTKAVVPYEMLTEVRQYTSRIGLLYGRNVDGYITQMTPEEEWAYCIMSESNVDVETLRLLALGKNVEYVVFNDSFHQYPEDMGQYGYQFVESLDGYSIFKISEE